MSRIVNMHEAKTRLSALVALAEAGEEVIIARDGKPAVRLIPVRAAQDVPQRPKPGFLQGLGTVSDDFNDPLPDEYYGF